MQICLQVSIEVEFSLPVVCHCIAQTLLLQPRHVQELLLAFQARKGTRSFCMSSAGSAASGEAFVHCRGACT